MNWEAIGAIGEVVGAIGVIVTLGYLAIQIRQNSSVVRSSTRQAISNAQVDMGLRMAGNPDLRAQSFRWASGEAPSTPDEEWCSLLARRAILRAFENQYHQHEDGTFDHEMWMGYRELMKQNFSRPGAREFWESNRHLYGSRFAQFVEVELFVGNDSGTAV